MKMTLFIFLFIAVMLFSMVRPVAAGYTSLDSSNPILFGGDHIVYKGEKIILGPRAFFIDGQLSNEEVAKYPYVFNSVNEAAQHLTDGTEASPMVLYLAPYVYWIDDPDDPEIRRQKKDADAFPFSGPYGLVIRCEWLRFYGLSEDAENVVLACNRGQTLGSQGNFTLFRFIGDGTRSENVTFGNYCNVDLLFPLKPALNREKRASAIVQAQLIHCNGDKIVARNTRFISRLNLCPFVGGKRVFFDRCHFESTDDALCGTGVYLNCTFDFYGGKPFYRTTGTGAVLLNCDIHSFTRGAQYFTKAGGQLAIVDTRFTSETVTYVGWQDVIPKEARCYQYNVTLNGKPLLISKNNPSSTVDMTGTPLLDAYRFPYNGKVVYNTYNLLRGDDDWDPMGIKQVVFNAEKANGRNYSTIPVQLQVLPTGISIETEKDTVKLSSKSFRFGNVESNNETITWRVASQDQSLVKLKSDESGTTCNVVPSNKKNEAEEVVVVASTASGLVGASVVTVSPAILEAPEFSSFPNILMPEPGVLSVDYRLDMTFKDQSIITWYRCKSATGSNPVEVAVSRFDHPMGRYELSAGDIGYYIMASVSPKHVRCNPGKAVATIMDQPIEAKDIIADPKLLHTTFENVSTKDQPKVIPGFWTFKPLSSSPARGRRIFHKGPDVWYYDLGKGGAENITGLIQAGNAGMYYTPVGKAFGNMKYSLTVVPFKTAGQGFSLAPLYADFLIKFDANSMTGYGLRFIRTTKYHYAVDCYFVKYKNGKTFPISNPISTTCYRPTCEITIEVRGNKIIAKASSPLNYYIPPDHPELATEVNLEIEIESNGFGGFGIEYLGGSPTLIKEVTVEWGN